MDRRPGTRVEAARQRGGFTADADRLPPGGGVPVQGVEVQVAAVGRGELQRETDLAGVIVGGRLALESVRALKRLRFARRRGPLIAATLREAHAGPGGQLRDVA